MLDPETLAVAQRIRARQCARVGLFPLHAGLQVMPTARRLALAFEVLGDRVDVLDTETPPALAEGSGAPDGGDRPAALERALEDSFARFDRVLVVFGKPAVAVRQPPCYTWWTAWCSSPARVVPRSSVCTSGCDGSTRNAISGFCWSK